jgi:hypothetical protein
MSKEQSFKAEVNENDALMYKKVDLGEKGPTKSQATTTNNDKDGVGGPAKKKHRRMLITKKQPPKPSFRNSTVIRSSYPKTKGDDKIHILEDIDPVWVECMVNPLFIKLVNERKRPLEACGDK